MMKLRKTLFTTFVVVLVSIFTMSQVSYATPYIDDLRQESPVDDTGDSDTTHATFRGPVDEGKTFIAVTAPGVEISAEERIQIDKQVRASLGAAFATGHVLRTGGNALPLEKQTNDSDLAERVEAADELLVQAAQALYDDEEYKQTIRALESLGWKNGTNTHDVRFAFTTDNAHEAALLKTGDLSLIGSSGKWNRGLEEVAPRPRGEALNEAPKGSHYVSLQLIESAIPALGEEDAMEFLKAWIAHETDVLNKETYVEPSKKQASILNEGYRQIRLHLAEERRIAQLRKTAVEIYNLDFSPYISTSAVPGSMEKVINEALENGKKVGLVRGFNVLNTGAGLVLQVNNLEGADNPIVQKLIVDASMQALRAAEQEEILSEKGTQVLTAPYIEQAKAVINSRGTLSMTERKSDPTIVAQFINGGIGAANLALYHAFIDPLTHPTGRISGETFTAVVEKAEDVRRGVKNRQQLVFGPEDKDALLAVIGDQCEYMITEIHAATGRFKKSNPGEPVAKVIVEPIDSEGLVDRPANPTVIVRCQGGSEAPGTIISALSKPYLAIAGKDDAYYKPTIPVSWQQAQTGEFGDDYVQVVGYQLPPYGNGKIRSGSIMDIMDPRATAPTGLFAERAASGEADAVQQQAPFRYQQERAEVLKDIITSQGFMDPHLSARGAEKISKEASRELADLGLWVDTPKTEDDPRSDWIVEKANAQAQGRCLTIIKADAMGESGHNRVPSHGHIATATTLELMEKEGIFKSTQHFGEGDDAQQIAVHNLGANSNKVHGGMYKGFWRMVAQAMAFDLEETSEGDLKVVSSGHYGVGQDINSPKVENIPMHQLAGLDDTVISAMAQKLREAGMEDHAKALEVWWQGIKDSGEVVVAETPFSGNIQGQGPGFAELPLPPEGEVRIGGIFSDKTGPAAFNMPITAILRQARERNISVQDKKEPKNTILDKTLGKSLKDLPGGGAVAVIQDTKGHKTIYLDVETQWDYIERLAANPDRYNYKYVVSKAKAGWDPQNVQDYVGDQILISTSTEKLSVISGGEYRGKDDSVCLANEFFSELLFEWWRTNVGFTQGDAMGSHYDTVRPEPIETAIASRDSRAIVSAFWIDVDEEDQMEWTDVFGTSAYDSIRHEHEEVTDRVWGAQGMEFTPVGVGSDRVEASYPLQKNLNRILAEDSEFAQQTTVDVETAVTQGLWTEQFDAIGHQISSKVARTAQDTNYPEEILLHEDFFMYGPDGAIAIQRYLQELGFETIDEAAEKSAIKLRVAMRVSVTPVPGDVSYTHNAQQQAEERFQNLLETINEVTEGAVELKPEWFTVIPETRLANYTTVSAAIGSREWVDTVPGEGLNVRVAIDAPQEEGKVISAAAAFYAALEAVAIGEQTPPDALMEKFGLQFEDGMMVPMPRPITATIGDDLRNYQEAAGNV